jgi:hypothetical protein
VVCVLAHAVTYALIGLEPRRVEVEAHLQLGVPSFAIVGLADRACSEAKEPTAHSRESLVETLFAAIPVAVARSGGLAETECRGCGAFFTPRRTTQIYCTKRCGQRHWEAEHRAGRRA